MEKIILDPTPEQRETTKLNTRIFVQSLFERAFNKSVDKSIEGMKKNTNGEKPVEE